MKCSITLCSLISTGAFFAAVGSLSAQSLESLGVLEGGLDSFATALNADGSIVVGDSDSTDGLRAFRWTRADGMQSLGVLTGGSTSFANGISADGSVIVGRSDSTAGNRAFRWTQAGGMESLGVLTGGSSSEANGISADGLVIIGDSDSTAGTRAFRWTQVGGLEDLGVLTGGSESHSEAANADGSVIAGRSDSTGGLRAFRWTQSSGLVDLGVLSGGSFSAAFGINADGSVIVGNSDSSGGTRAFRWTQADGMQSLGVLEGGSSSRASGVSADGSVVVGDSDISGGSRAFRWTAAGGLENLGVLSGGSSSNANAVSADGSIIVGTSDTADGSRAFIYITQMQDLANVRGSITEVANAVTASVDQNTYLARRLRQEHCNIAPGNTRCLGIRGLASSLFEGTNAFGGDVLGAYQINERLELGGAVGLYGESGKGGALEAYYGVGLGGYVDIGVRQAQWGAITSTIRMRLDGAWFYTDAKITRGTGFTDVQQGTGDTAFSSGTAGLRVFADHLLNASTLVQPYVGAYWEGTVQTGYREEAGLDTSVQINEQSFNAVAAVFGIGTELVLTPAIDLTLSVGGEVDMYADGVEVSGLTNIPGLTEFVIGADRPRNWVRGIVRAGLGYDLAEFGEISLNGELFSSRFQEKLGGDISLKYWKSF